MKPGDAPLTASDEPYAVWRWADPDASASGVSGPTDKTATSDPAYTTGYTGKIINQNNEVLGGPVAYGTAPTADGKGNWSSNNIGLNDEPFSFHPGGCNAVFLDGSAHFLSDTLDAVTLRRLITRAEAKTVNRDF